MCVSVTVYLNRPKKRAQRLEKPPRYPPNRDKKYKIRKNPLLRMRVASLTKIDLKIEFSGSKNPLGTTRFALKALIAQILSAAHARCIVH